RMEEELGIVHGVGFEAPAKRLVGWRRQRIIAAVEIVEVNIEWAVVSYVIHIQDEALPPGPGADVVGGRKSAAGASSGPDPTLGHCARVNDDGLPVGAGINHHAAALRTLGGVGGAGHEEEAGGAGGIAVGADRAGVQIVGRGAAVDGDANARV